MEIRERGMIMTKIVFFDIDDTLLDAQKELPASAKAAVRQLQKQGIYTAIATGRAPFLYPRACGIKYPFLYLF